MALTLPYWFNMRQGKVEPAGENIYKLTAPNQGEAFITIRKNEVGQWIPALRAAADGPDLAVGEKGYDTTMDAWYAAFELYRTALVV